VLRPRGQCFYETSNFKIRQCGKQNEQEEDDRDIASKNAEERCGLRENTEIIRFLDSGSRSLPCCPLCLYLSSCMEK
jgi:hypothetical protein